MGSKGGLWIYLDSRPRQPLASGRSANLTSPSLALLGSATLFCGEKRGKCYRMGRTLAFYRRGDVKAKGLVMLPLCRQTLHRGVHNGRAYRPFIAGGLLKFYKRSCSVPDGRQTLPPFPEHPRFLAFPGVSYRSTHSMFYSYFPPPGHVMVRRLLAHAYT